ncbi:hypothetical protein N9954_09520 [Maribacter sp.]|nr:hypothetical protein [Maribacter sp.]
MKMITTIIKESPLGNLSSSYKYAVISLFSGIVVTVIALLVFVLNNIATVGSSFNF